jgi:hypothetical protein
MKTHTITLKQTAEEKALIALQVVGSTHNQVAIPTSPVSSSAGAVLIPGEGTTICDKASSAVSAGAGPPPGCWNGPTPENVQRSACVWQYRANRSRGPCSWWNTVSPPAALLLTSGNGPVTASAPTPTSPRHTGPLAAEGGETCLTAGVAAWASTSMAPGLTPTDPPRTRSPVAAPIGAGGGGVCCALAGRASPPSTSTSAIKAKVRRRNREPPARRRLACCRHGSPSMHLARAGR